MSNPYYDDFLKHLEPLQQAMVEYASCIRGDWNDFDGRTERSIIEGWVVDMRNPNLTTTIEQYRQELNMCPDGNAHWLDHCYNDCPTNAKENA